MDRVGCAREVLVEEAVRVPRGSEPGPNLVIGKTGRSDPFTELAGKLGLLLKRLLNLGGARQLARRLGSRLDGDLRPRGKNRGAEQEGNEGENPAKSAGRCSHVAEKM